MDTITITQEEYEDLVDIRDHGIAMREIAEGTMETLTADEVDEYVAAVTPLAFWRKKRGISQATLAASLGISQPYLAQIETGKRLGDVNLYAKLAKQLKLRIEDLLDEPT